jgi:hypothetical protein
MHRYVGQGAHTARSAFRHYVIGPNATPISLQFLRSEVTYTVFWSQDNKEPHSSGVSIQVHKAVMTMLNSRGDAATTASNAPQTASENRNSAVPSQQPAMASPPKRDGTQANDTPVSLVTQCCWCHY